jgi:polar amino acid transport system substrate-binding protein
MMLRLSIPINSRREKLFLLPAMVVLILSFYQGMALATSGKDEPDLTEVKKKLVVGTKVTPPFAMKDANGNWTGISIDLWRQISAELNLSYEWRELDQHGLLEGITNGSLDAVVANLTITPSRLDKFDFTYPFYTTGLGIAVARQDGDVAMTIILQVFSWAVLKIIIAVVAILLLVGLAIWQFERKRNSEQFGGTTVEGIASGFWFSAVTMTTVGYGDKHPKTLGGRLVALFWMFVSVILVSIFTAMITSLLTVKQLVPSIRGLEDLKRENVGTLPYTTSEAFLKNHHIVFKTYPSVLEGLEALESGEIKALVYDIPALRYWIRQQFQGKIEVLPQTYSQENYGIALRDNSPLRKMINRILLEKIRDQEWQKTLYHYLGG